MLREKLSFLMVFFLLLTGGNSLNWMAAGDFAPGNMTIIWDKVNSIRASALRTELTGYAKTISDDLNGLWDPAWNVFIVFHGNTNKDAVVRGYAFNGHWFWVNGIKITIGYISVILWKDYNCAGWVSHDDSVAGVRTSTYGSGATNNIQTFVTASGIINDIWSLGGDFVDAALASQSSLLQDKYAYTIIVSQLDYALYFWRACVKNYVKINQIDRNIQGSGIMLQMR